MGPLFLAIDLAAQQFDSKKQLHEYQLNKRLLDEKETQFTVCKQFYNSYRR